MIGLLWRKNSNRYVSFFLQSLLVSSFVVCVFSFGVDATVLFSDNFESADFSAWTTSYESGGSVSVDSSSPVSGSYNLHSVMSSSQNNGWGIVYKDFSGSGYNTFFIQADGVIFAQPPNTSGEDQSVISITNAAHATGIVYAGVTNSGGSFYWWLWVRVGASLVAYTNSSACDPTVAHNLEVGWFYDGSAGFARLWVDGVLTIDVSGIDTNNYVGNFVNLGFSYSDAPTSTACNLYLDDVVVSDSYVGVSVPYVEESVSVVLNSPGNGSVVDVFNVDFNFTPAIVGVDGFQNASLIVNGSSVAGNQSVLVNASLNTISYSLSGNGTYLWNVLVFNSSVGVLAADNFSLTVGVYEVPESTPVPSPSVSAGGFSQDDLDEWFVLGGVLVFIVGGSLGAGLFFVFKKREDE